MFHVMTMKLVPLGLFVSLLTIQSSVMKPLRCTISDSKNSIDCSGRELTTTIILINLDEGEKIKTVDFSNNKIIQVQGLDRFKRAQKINFQLNAIEKIPSDAFSALEDLEEVDLSFNNIEVLDPYLFIKNKLLKRVTFQGNSLAVAADKPILCSASLQNLDLGTCGMPRITRENLLCLPSVTDLDLSANGLTSLTPSVFSPLTNLVSINLRTNRFYCNCQLPELLRWARSKKSDMSSSDPVYCVLPNNRGRTEFEKIEKDLNCSVHSSTPHSSALKSQNENASSEFYDYILISYDTSVQPVDGHVSTRYMGIISSKLYTIEALLSLVLFLLVIITGMLFCRHYRTVSNVNDSASEYSASAYSNDMTKQLIEKCTKEPVYTPVK